MSLNALTVFWEPDVEIRCIDVCTDHMRFEHDRRHSMVAWPCQPKLIVRGKRHEPT